MIYCFRIVVLICSVCLAVAIAVAWGQITEDDVVNLLHGKPPTMVPSQPAGIALHVTFSTTPGAGVTKERSSKPATSDETEALYTTLIPLARALEAGIVSGSRYVVRVVPASPPPAEQAARLGQHLVETVEHFFTTYFAIPRDRLSLQVIPSQPESAALMKGVVEPQRWKLEVFRHE